MRLCILCAGIKSSCCCVGRDIFITLGDVERISESTGYEDFYEYRVPSDRSYIEQTDDPQWNYYTLKSGGRRRVLKRGRQLHCIFLSGKGCLLSLETRPLVCRLHPYVYNEERLTGLADECPVELLNGPETIHESIGLNESMAEAWRKTLYRELVEESMNLMDDMKRGDR
ncbi:MAG: YkgJ family cysteine cluster protein [Spirochaetales bacterium]|nr:YkgJ family cysteine cluster protein [Spirochaetales bacterium]